VALGIAMPRLLILAGALWIAVAAADQLVAYLAGVRFDKFFWWPFVFGPLELTAFGALATAVAVTLYQVATRRLAVKWGFVAAAMPVVAFLATWFPLATFTDGLRHAVQTRLTAEQLFLLADDVRPQPIARFPFEQYESQLGVLRARHDDVFALSPGIPRVSADHGRVELVYGSGLIKHWDIAFSAHVITCSKTAAKRLTQAFGFTPTSISLLTSPCNVDRR
jgi:hypothetical protein